MTRGPMKTANKLSIAIAAFLLIAGGVYLLTGTTPQTAIAADEAEPVVQQAVTETETTAQEQEEAAPAIDVAKAMADRTMGDPAAPVTIHEYASLTCSHCADFYKETFPDLKKNYIDTGKVYFIYHDYPLNAPALEAAMVARCLPEARYFQFIKFLFESQEAWAYNSNHKDALKQNAKLLGLSEASYDACVDNLDLKQALVDKMQKASEELKIQSTPSFMLNNGQLIHGAQSYDIFSKMIDAMIAAGSGGDNKTESNGTTDNKSENEAE